MNEVESILFKDLLKNQKRKFVFLGEAGSGKSEISINFALSLAHVADKEVHFFDMDQSKPLFRSRNVKEVLESNGIVFHAGEQYLDAPYVPHGIESILGCKDKIVVLDVGGNSIGSINIGQYAGFLNEADTTSFFIVNYYRAFSKTGKYIRETMDYVLRSSGIRDVQVISNPNVGKYTTIEDVAYGHGKVCEFLEQMGHTNSILTVTEDVWNNRIKESSENILKIKPYMNII